MRGRKVTNTSIGRAFVVGVAQFRTPSTFVRSIRVTPFRGLSVTTKRVYFIFRLLFITCTITVGHMTDASSLSHMTHYESFLGLHFPYDSL